MTDRAWFILMAFCACCAACGEVTRNPFPEPIAREEGAITVGITEFAVLPTYAGSAARPMLMTVEPVSARMFVNDMWGRLFSITYEGSVAIYLDLRDPRWALRVESRGRERGFQSFAIHPQFAQPDTPGFGKIYTWADSSDMTRKPDFRAPGDRRSHHTVLLEWTARDPSLSVYDGDGPREVLRIEQPFQNHNGGQIGFNRLAVPGDADYGMLYIGVADGGSSGDPLGLAQNPGSIFGKLLRIDPLASDRSNNPYGIPAGNPFVNRDGALAEIYALGLRNPQRFAWDPKLGTLYLVDIGQNAIEELNVVQAGDNLGWPLWEGSFRFVGRSGVETKSPRSDATMTYPVVEFDQVDPLFQSRVAATGVLTIREATIPVIQDRLIFGDLVSGEVFHVPLGPVPDGGQTEIRRLLFRPAGSAQATTLLEILADHAHREGNEPPSRADLRFGAGPDGRIFLLNKHDGIVRELVN